MPDQELAYSEMSLAEIEVVLRDLRSRRETRPEPRVRLVRAVKDPAASKAGAKPVVDMTTLFGDVLSEEGQ